MAIQLLHRAQNEPLGGMKASFFIDVKQHERTTFSILFFYPFSYCKR